MTRPGERIRVTHSLNHMLSTAVCRLLCSAVLLTASPGSMDTAVYVRCISPYRHQCRRGEAAAAAHEHDAGGCSSLRQLKFLFLNLIFFLHFFNSDLPINTDNFLGLLCCAARPTALTRRPVPSVSVRAGSQAAMPSLRPTDGDLETCRLCSGTDALQCQLCSLQCRRRAEPEPTEL